MANFYNGCTCDDYPNLDCPQHGQYEPAERITLLTLAKMHHGFGNTPLERGILAQDRAAKMGQRAQDTLETIAKLQASLAQQGQVIRKILRGLEP